MIRTSFSLRTLFTVVIAVLSFALLVETPTSAIQVDTNYYSSNQIVIYDPNYQCAAATTGAETGATAGGENIEEVLKYFTGKGFSLASASGFVGNMTGESGVEPRKLEGGALAPEDATPRNGQGFGLVQWTWSDRQKPLVALARSTDRKTTDIKLQLDYIWKELNAGYKGTLETLAKAEKDGSISPKKATIIIHGRTAPFMSNPDFADAPKHGYESSGDSDYTKFTKNRIDPAIGAYNKYRDSIKDGAGITIDGSASASLSSSSTCSGSANGSAFTIDGMAFPLIVTEEIIRKGSRASSGGGTWCYAKETNCHHDYNAADIMAPPGTTVVAAKGGQVTRVSVASSGKGSAPRDSVSIRSDDGNIWFYTHLQPSSAIVKQGQKVNAGDKLAVVGPSSAADYTAPHLHIDELPSSFKARVSCASAACTKYPFIDIQPLMKELYEKMIAAQKGL